jgi:hypothetical protein
MGRTVDVMPGAQPAGDLEPGSWPEYDCLELAALPTAVACARLHARNMLWEWGLDWLAPNAELLVAELTKNAVRDKETRDEAPVRLRLSSDGGQVLIEVWDADPRPPAAGRGLRLLAALGARWDWYLTNEPGGKVVWCQLGALAPRPAVIQVRYLSHGRC